MSIGDSEAIESEFFLSLATLLANVAAPSFGQQTSAEVKMLKERELRKMTATAATGETLPLSGVAAATRDAVAAELAPFIEKADENAASTPLR